MMKRLALLLTGAALLAAPASFGQGANLFPLAEFKFSPAEASLKTGLVQPGDKRSAALFIGSKPEGFLLYFQEQEASPGGGHPELSLDSSEKYRDNPCSLKLDFTSMNAAKLNRCSFMIRPSVKVSPGRTYVAVICMKTSTPGMKIAATLMGANSGYRGRIVEPELLWRPFQFELKIPEKPKGEPLLEYVSVDVVSPGVFWIGKIEVVEKSE